MKWAKQVNENKDPRIFDKVKYIQNKLDSIIQSNKQKHYSHLSKKFVDSMASPKSYWSTLKMFLNDKKVPCISSLKQQYKYEKILKRKQRYSTSSLLSNALR